MLQHGELTRWTVTLIGGGEGAEIALRNDIKVSMLKRTKKNTSGDRYSIGRLMSPRDEAIDLNEAEWKAALDVTRGWAEGDLEVPNAPAGQAVRRVRGLGAPGVPSRADCGLLFLYVLDPQEANAEFARDTPAISAFAISFPHSRQGQKVEYKVNNVLWEQEFGSAD